jgi:hypothetical protein
VSVMPCTAKKDEAVRPELSGDLDRVLTTRELARMIRARGIAFGALPEEGHFDNPLGESTGAGQIFGASGGVMESIVRTASHVIAGGTTPPLEWHQLRGVEQGVKTADVPGVGKVAVCNGIAAAQRLLETDAWREEFVAIEVMACVGGCLGGGGEPKSMDPAILEKRMHAIYEIDEQAPRRRAHENPDVQKLYATELTQPDVAHALLHTSFAGRDSQRLLLMRFLDCVDRRDAAGAASLFHPDGLWSTSSAFGDIRGAGNIEALIQTRLPPRKYGPAYARHRMESRAAFDDLIVVAPGGERCRFIMETDMLRGGHRPRMVIRRLVREVL